MLTKTRLAVAFGVAACIPPLSLALYAPLGDVLTGSTFLATFMVLLPFSVAAAIFVGIPLYLLGRRLNAVNWTGAILSGVAAGVIVAFAERFPNALELHDLRTLIPVAVLAAAGFLLVLKVLGRINAKRDPEAM